MINLSQRIKKCWVNITPAPSYVLYVWFWFLAYLYRCSLPLLYLYTSTRPAPIFFSHSLSSSSSSLGLGYLPLRHPAAPRAASSSRSPLHLSSLARVVRARAVLGRLFLSLSWSLRNLNWMMIMIYIYIYFWLILHTIYNSHDHKSRAQCGRISPAPQAPASGQKTKSCIEGEDPAAAGIRRFFLLEQRVEKRYRIISALALVPRRSRSRIVVVVACRQS